jgi:hypothetical protein
MRFKQVKVGERVITDSTEINKELTKSHLQWLNDSEIENAEIEIKNNTLIWLNGSFNAGKWHYGVFRQGRFSGTWENGIWEGGTFNKKAKWKSGIGNPEQ